MNGSYCLTTDITAQTCKPDFCGIRNLIYNETQAKYTEVANLWVHRSSPWLLFAEWKIGPVCEWELLR